MFIAFQKILKLFACGKIQLYFRKYKYTKVYGTVKQNIKRPPHMSQQIRIADLIKHKPIFPQEFILYPYQSLDAVQIAS